MTDGGADRGKKNAAVASSRLQYGEPVIVPRFSENLNEKEKDVFLAELARGSWAMLGALETKYASNPSDLDTALLLAECYVSHGRIDAAVPLLRHLGHAVRGRKIRQQAFPGSNVDVALATPLSVARCCRRAGLRKAAISVCVHAVAGLGQADRWDMEEMQLFLGMLYFDDKRWSGLIDLMEEYLTKHRASFVAYWLLAVAYMRQGERAEASAALLFGCRYLDGLIGSALGRNSQHNSTDRLLYQSDIVPELVRQMADNLPTAHSGMDVLAAAYLFANGRYAESVECLRRPGTRAYCRSSRSLWCLRRVMMAVAKARRCMVRGDYTAASDGYRKAAALDASSLGAELRLMALALEWERQLSRCFMGRTRAETLAELKRRVDELGQQFEEIQAREKIDAGRGIAIASTAEGFWCTMRGSWVRDLGRILAFEPRWWGLPEWRVAQRDLQECGWATLSKGFGVIELFGARFEQIAVQHAYTSLDRFTSDEQAELLRILEPASVVGDIFPKFRDVGDMAAGQLLRATKKISEIHAMVKKQATSGARRRASPSKDVPPTAGEVTLPGPSAPFTVWASDAKGVPLGRKGGDEAEVSRLLRARDRYDVLVNGRQVYAKQQGKKSVLIGDVKGPMVLMLTLLMRYKNRDLKAREIYEASYKEGDGTPQAGKRGHDERDLLKSYIRSPVCRLRSALEVSSFAIENSRSFGYRCEGDFTFCLILPSLDEPLTRLARLEPR